MKLLLKRYSANNDSSGGLLFVNDEFFCFTCEDEKRDVKVMHETRIPAGTYHIQLRDQGGMTQRYAERYEFHRGMLHLQNVPGFEWVYIHVGNTDDDTSGCILVGYTANHLDRENKIANSVLAYTDLYNLVLLAMGKGESIEIEIRDE